MTVRQIAYRLKSEGKAEVVRDQREIKGAITETLGAAETASDRAAAAADRQTKRYQVLAQAARDAEQAEARQRQINAIIGVGPEGKSARDSAALFEAEMAAAERYEARGRQLKAVLDPVGAAQDRLNDELAEYAVLAKRGEISAQQLAQAQVMARQRFDETTASLERQSRGLTRQAVASRLNLARQGADVAVTAAMGMNPAMIAIQQGPQILDAMATSGIKANASMVALAGGVGLVASGLAVVGAAWLAGEQQALEYERAVTGLGRTAGLTATELEVLAIESAKHGEVSIRSAREQATAYLATGRIGEESIRGLIAIGKDYASVMGMDAEEATQSLAKAMLEPDKAGRDLTRTMGLLDQATLDQIESLTKSGDLMAAQKLLIEALDGAMAGHADRIGDVASLWDAAAIAVSNYWDRLGEALYVTRDERIQKLENDLRTGSVGTAGGRGDGPDRRRDMESELWRLTTQRDIEAMLAEGEAVEARGNQNAQLARDRRERDSRTRRGGRDNGQAAAREAERKAREELQRLRREEDREAFIEQQAAIATNDMETLARLEREGEIRQRLRQLVDDGVAGEKAKLQVMAEQQVLDAARADGQQREITRLSQATDFQIMRILGEERFLESATRREEIEEKILAYQKEGMLPADARLTVEREQLELAQARAEVVERIGREERAAHALQLARLRGDEDEVRRLDYYERVRRRAREIEGRDRDNPLNFGEGTDRALIEINAEVAAEAEGVRRAWIKGFVSDIRQGGLSNALSEQMERASDRMIDRLIDRALTVDWSALFEGGGADGSLWSRLFSLGSKLFGSGSPAPGNNATGTEFWRGGLTWVGEAGKELVDLPRGSRVLDHNRSMQLAASVAPPPPFQISMPVSIHAPGADPAALQRVEASIDRLAKSVPGMAVAAVADYRQRSHGG